MEGHPEVKPVFRKDVAEAMKTPRITREYYTKYEFVDLLGIRAQQIAEGARPLVDIAGLKTSDPMFVWNVAKREIEQRKLPNIVVRRMPDGTAEYWSVEELETMW
jgi:DNA-directed RNA polymerase subunit K/omega